MSPGKIDHACASRVMQTEGTSTVRWRLLLSRQLQQRKHASLRPFQRPRSTGRTRQLAQMRHLSQIGQDLRMQHLEAVARRACASRPWQRLQRHASMLLHRQIPQQQQQPVHCQALTATLLHLCNLLPLITPLSGQLSGKEAQLAPQSRRVTAAHCVAFRGTCALQGSVLILPNDQGLISAIMRTSQIHEWSLTVCEYATRQHHSCKRWRSSSRTPRSRN